jgi:hypothetical protein
MATVTGLQLFAVDLPFKTAFRHAAAARTTSESLFLRVGLDSGASGWGEALPRAYVSGESRQDAFALLHDAVLPALVGRAFGSLSEVVSFLEKCDGKAPPEWVGPDVPRRRPGAASTWPCSTRSAGRSASRPCSAAICPEGRWSDTATAGSCPPDEAGPM